MSLEGVAGRAEPIGDDAARKARDHILARSNLPIDISAEPIEGGIVLSGKRLRYRYITDPALRNYVR